MTQAYSDPSRADDPHALPDVEVFEVAQGPSGQLYIGEMIVADCDIEETGPGFYYRFCFPGCLPDSDPIGPFPSEAEALADAQDIS